VFNNSIPKPHPFVSLPLQSGIFKWPNVIKEVSLPKILTGITIFIGFYIIRTYVIPLEFEIPIKITLLEDLLVKFNISKDIFLGFLAVISRLFVLGFWQEVMRAFSHDNLPLALGPSICENDPNTLYSTMGKGENPSKQIPDKEVSGGAVGGSGININPEDPSFWSNLVSSIRDETRDLIHFIKDIGAKKLEKYNDLWSSDDPEMDRVVIVPENAEGFITLLQKQSNMFTAFVRNRMEWVDLLLTN